MCVSRKHAPYVPQYLKGGVKNSRVCIETMINNTQVQAPDSIYLASRTVTSVGVVQNQRRQTSALVEAETNLAGA